MLPGLPHFKMLRFIHMQGHAVISLHCDHAAVLHKLFCRFMAQALSSYCRETLSELLLIKHVLVLIKHVLVFSVEPEHALVFTKCADLFTVQPDGYDSD